MKSFVISLRDSSRLEETCVRLGQFGLKPEVRYGLRGADLPVETVAEMTFRHPIRDLLIRRLAPGELGCSLSHYLVMNHIVRSGIERALIFEDDVRFSRDPMPTLEKLEGWASSQRNYILNWGGQKDPRFALPIWNEAFKSNVPPFSIRRYPDMLWNTHCLLVDREYCMERLRKAFPVVYIFDVYGMLQLDTSFFVMREDSLSCDPDIMEVASTSTIEARKPSLASRLFPRSTMARLRLERIRDRLIRGVVGDGFWTLERTQEYLDELLRLGKEAGATR